MDSNTPADPWDIPAQEADDAPGVVAVASAPDEVEDGTDRAESPDAETPDPEAHAETSASEATEPEPADAELVAPEETEEPEESVDVTDEASDSEPIAVDDETSDQAEGPAHRFDLGLDDDEPWNSEAGEFETGTAFDLIPPSETEEEDDPAYEVDEPPLSETFVSTSASGRPDHSVPQLRDPAPMFAVEDEDLADVTGEAHTPTEASAEVTAEAVTLEEDVVEGTTEVAEEPVHDDGASGTTVDPDQPTAADPDPSTDGTEEPERQGFRLPGLSFGRSQDAETDDEPLDAVADQQATDVVSELDEAPEAVADPDIAEPAAEQSVEAPAEDEPAVPSAWADAPPAGAEDPDSPFAQATPPPADPFETPDEPAEAEQGTADDESEHSGVAVEVVDEPEVAEAPPPTAEADVPQDPNEEEVDVTIESETDFELTDPDPTDALEAPELYVTETQDDERPTALLTVDNVPGATIAQAIDVVTAVASAPDEVELADALERTMAQLRDKAVALGGHAVISVRTEVQEVGGGFLATASGTVVTLG